MLRASVIVGAACAVLGLARGSAAADAPYVDGPGLLPGLPIAADPQPGSQPGCAQPTPACIDGELARMRALQGAFGCDHRGVFDTNYLVLTETLRDTLASSPALFADPHHVESEDALFADYYSRTVYEYGAGGPVPPAWRIAFDTAARGDATAAQDMLLGINAHAQRDMSFVLAKLGLHPPGGLSRKGDHDLNRAYEPVVRAITQRFDPFTGISNPGSAIDNLAALELVRTWREGVWRHAERLLSAPGPAQRGMVAAAIEANAAATAQLIAAPSALPTGYRARRDAYCASH